MWGVPAGPCAHDLEEQAGPGKQASGVRAPKGQLVIGASDRGQHAKKEQATPPHANVDGAQLWGSSELSSRISLGFCNYNATSALGKV